MEKKRKDKMTVDEHRQLCVSVCVRVVTEQ